jgi:fructose-1,6-bisphosphatase I
LSAFLAGQDTSLGSVLDSLQSACKEISHLVRTASFEDSQVMGLHEGGGSINVQGEEQKILDVLANDILKVALSRSEVVQTIASEEEDTPISRPKSKTAKKSYIVAFDPLDGSSNIDVGIPVGTIFGIFEHSKDKNPTEDVLQPGRKLVGAGYCLYSAATTLVITIGDGVHGFTLNESLGEFVLTHPNMKIPSRGKIYSFNEGNRWDWEEPVQSYITSIQKGEGETKTRYSGRLVGSMVADIHRTLQYGGIFGYPADARNPNGKLRLLYEVAPMSFIVEQAGGKATTGTLPLMDVQPDDLHQRVPCIVGSPEDVEELQSHYSPFVSKESLSSRSHVGAKCTAAGCVLP